MNQTNEFLSGEGDKWLKRNRKKLNPANDPILLTIESLAGFPKKGKCLEIGCSNGWRLKELHKRYDMYTWGADPSQEAIEEAKGTKGIVDAKVTTARNVRKYFPRNFDVVIYGFCLYLCEREDLFLSIASGDDVLKEGGLMIVHDFDTSYPCKNPYHHKAGLWSYKQDYAKMFLANPAYSQLFAKEFPETHNRPRTKVSIMRKSIERGWPLCE